MRGGPNERVAIIRVPPQVHRGIRDTYGGADRVKWDIGDNLSIRHVFTGSIGVDA